MKKHKMPLVAVDDDGIRPAGQSDRCFFCNQLIGTPHKRDCVAVHRMVKVRYVFDLEIEVPYFWEKKNIEFWRNESSSCAGNAVGELEDYQRKQGYCLCGQFNSKVLEIPDIKPYIKHKEKV